MIDEKVVSRFWSRVDIRGEDECWYWTGSLNSKGYGQVRLNNTTTGVHRLSYMLHKGAIGAGLHIDHQCRTRNCVNPTHLRAVTPRINAIENNIGPTAENAWKTHCSNGHPFSEENTRMTVDGHRECRVCQCGYREKNRQKVKAEQRAARRKMAQEAAHAFAQSHWPHQKPAPVEALADLLLNFSNGGGDPA